MPIVPPGYRLRKLHDYFTITSKLYTIFSNKLHRKSLISHLLKKTKWTKHTFDLVNWDAHSQAFNKLTRSAHLSTGKIIHNLTNTNWQNHLYYDTSSTCPCCNLEEETFQHVLTCPSDQASKPRSRALADLLSGLQAAQTPQQCYMIQHSPIGVKSNSMYTCAYCRIYVPHRHHLNCSIHGTSLHHWLVSAPLRVQWD